MREVIYLAHPVSAKQKAECKAKGLKIIDIKFKPAEAEEPTKKKAKAKKSQFSKLKSLLISGLFC